MLVRIMKKPKHDNGIESDWRSDHRQEGQVTTELRLKEEIWTRAFQAERTHLASSKNGERGRVDTDEKLKAILQGWRLSWISWLGPQLDTESL